MHPIIPLVSTSYKQSSITADIYVGWMYLEQVIQVMHCQSKEPHKEKS